MSLATTNGVKKPFLVRVITSRSHHWVDIVSGIIYDPLDIPYEGAHHGLCEQYGRPVLKKIVDDGFPPLVLIARYAPKPFRYRRSIGAQFTNAGKVKERWMFSPFELEETAIGEEMGLTPREIAIRVGAPLEAIENVLEKIGGDRDGVKRDQAGRKRTPVRYRTTRRRKDAS